MNPCFTVRILMKISVFYIEALLQNASFHYIYDIWVSRALRNVSDGSISVEVIVANVSAQISDVERRFGRGLFYAQGLAYHRKWGPLVPVWGQRQPWPRIYGEGHARNMKGEGDLALVHSCWAHISLKPIAHSTLWDAGSIPIVGTICLRTRDSRISGVTLWPTKGT